MVWKMCLFLDTAILGIYVQFQGGYHFHHGKMIFGLFTYRKNFALRRSSRRFSTCGDEPMFRQRNSVVMSCVLPQEKYVDDILDMYIFSIYRLDDFLDLNRYVR